MSEGEKVAATGADLALVSQMVAVGAVTPTSVRLWARLVRSSRLRLLLREGDSSWCSDAFDVVLSRESTCAFTYPDDFAAAAALHANRRYTFEIQDNLGGLIGAGKFKTPAASSDDAPEKWCLAFLSCHQPFGDDGQVTAQATHMLSAVNKAFATFEPEVVLFLGDQIYADEPPLMSLFENRDAEPSVLLQPSDDVRRRFDERYRLAWQVPGWPALHACAATACVPDDHDIIDNWGSDVHHSEPTWQKVRDTALDVALSWQGQRSGLPSLAASFQQSFRWQNAGIMLLDVRSQRRVSHDPSESQIVDPAQIDRLEMFLRRSADLPVVFIGISVPLIHMPSWLSAVGHRLPGARIDFDDRWSNPVWVQTRDRLLTLFNEHRRAHPEQQIVLLSGDIHAGWAVSLYDDKADENKGGNATENKVGKPILQFVSSPITNAERTLTGAISNAVLEVSDVVGGQVAGLHVHNIAGVVGAATNPFGGLNVGFVEVCRATDKTTVRFRLVSHGEDTSATEPVIVFDSGTL